MSDPQSHSGVGASVVFALVAAALGMGACRVGFDLVVPRLDGLDTAVRRVLLLAPFVGGALVTAGVYWAFTRADAAPRARAAGGAAPAGAAVVPRAGTAGRTDTAGAGRRSGALVTFLVVCGLSAGIGALLAGAFVGGGGDSGPHTTAGEAAAGAISGAWQGAVIGLGLGLLLAIPAALAVWLLGRTR